MEMFESMGKVGEKTKQNGRESESQQQTQQIWKNRVEISSSNGE